MYNAINAGQIQYLNFSQVYANKVRCIPKYRLLQVKHLMNTTGICRALKYLLPQSLNSKIKPYIFKL